MSLDTKYRPLGYGDLLGQESTVKILKQYVATGAGFYQSYVFAGPFGSGKCVVGDTLVSTGLGLIPIRELMGQGEISPISIRVRQEGGCQAEAKYSYRGGLRDTVKIVSQRGLSLEGTGNHRVRVLRGGEITWASLGELVVGDYLCVDRSGGLFGPGADLGGFRHVDVVGGVSIQLEHSEWEAPASLTPGWGRLMGYLLGGESCDWSTSITAPNVEPDAGEDILALITGLCGAPGGTLESKTRIGLSAHRITSGKPLAFLEFAGASPTGAGSAVVPWSVLRSPRQVCRQFLTGYFEAGGHLSRSGIGITSRSESLISMVQILLLQFGIMSRKYPKCVKNCDTCWGLFIGGTSREIFQGEIGFFSSRKKSALKALVGPTPTTQDRSTHSSDKIPGQHEKVTLWFRSLPLASQSSRAGRLFPSRYGRVGLSKKVLGHLLEEFKSQGDPSLESHFRRLQECDFFYDPVVSVSESKAEVFDLTVPDGEMFSANGLMNHNTTLGRILARALLCDAPVEGNPCDACISCRSIIDRGSSEDFVEIDAATNSGKADVKQITESVEYHTFSGKRRIYLFDESHRLTPGALDALLKPLEETVPGSQDKKLICIFCTTEPEGMKHTILSRCAPVFMIQTVPPDQITKRLDFICEQENLERDEDALHLIAEVSECHIRDAIKAVEGVSRLGLISRKNVLTYLNLDKNGIFLDLLLSLEDTGRAIVHAKELLKVITPVMVYEKLISICMMSWMEESGAGKIPSYWDLEKIRQIGRHYGDRLLLVTQRLSKRPKRPSPSMLLCDLAYLSKGLAGSVPLTNSDGPILVAPSIFGPSQVSAPQNVNDRVTSKEPTGEIAPPASISSPTPPAAKSPEPVVEAPAAKTTSDGVHLPKGAVRSSDGSDRVVRVSGELTEKEFVLFLSRSLEERGLLDSGQER